MLRTRALLAACSIAALLLPVSARAQGERATAHRNCSINPSGTIIVGAALRIRNVATNVATTTKTNSAGIYYLPALPPGQYELRVEHIRASAHR